jgi:hypothetical protein
MNVDKLYKSNSGLRAPVSIIMLKVLVFSFKTSLTELQHGKYMRRITVGLFA